MPLQATIAARLLSISAAVLAGGCLVSGCLSHARPGAASATSPPAPTVKSGGITETLGPTLRLRYSDHQIEQGVAAGTGIAASIQLPVEDYLLVDRDTELLSAAAGAAIHRCMASHGYGYQAPGPNDDAGTFLSRRYGITDLNLAKRRGYHLDVDRAVAGPPLSATEHAVLSQCADAAQQQLGQHTDRASAADRLNQQSFTASEQLPAVRSALVIWSRCMRTHGYSYPTPLAAAYDPGFRAASPSRREIATAVADIECKLSTGLLPIWFTAEQRVQADEIARDPATYARLYAEKTAMLQRARQLLGSG